MSKAAQAAGYHSVSALNTLTLDLIPDIRLATAGMVLLKDTAPALSQVRDSMQSSQTVLNLQPILATNAQDKLKLIRHELPKSKITAALWKKITQTDNTQLIQFTDTAHYMLENPASWQGTWLIFLQNPDELRATGGFTGAYALLTIEDGVIHSLTIEDIYDADGQFTGYVTPPTGVSEYLSSGNGLRLPDANWHPDFPSSAQTQLAFFGLADKTDITGVVGVQADTISTLLKLTGPISLPDYDVTVTPENITSVLRTGRDDFFPGSRQKKHILTQFSALFISQLQQSISQQPVAFLGSVHNALDTKDVQIFATDTGLQTLLAQQNWAGAVSTQSDLDLFWVESNVGINKANALVDRSLRLDLSNNHATLTANITNTNKPGEQSSDTSSAAAHNAYVNYQRLLIPPDWQLNQILIENEPVANWDEEILTTSSGDRFRQIGFLTIVPEQGETVIQMELTGPTAPETLTVYSQAGTGNTPLTVCTSNCHDFILNTDLVLTLLKITAVTQPE